MDEQEEPPDTTATAAPPRRSAPIRPGQARHAPRRGTHASAPRPFPRAGAGPARPVGLRAPPERRLAALAFLDVAGYSRLMGEDEAATLRRWLSLRDGVVEARVPVWRGRVVDRAGDGLFVRFGSVLDAVRWALDVQSALATAPAAVEEEPPLRARVAVHLGDVFEAPDGGVHGDAVNVAARLQEHAAPGGVVVSSAVHEQVRHLLDYEAAELGPLALKNIDRPVRAFRVGPAAPRRVGPAPAAGVPAAAAVPAAPVPAVPGAAVAAGAVLLGTVAAFLAAEGAAPGAAAAWAAASGSATGLVFTGWAVRRASRVRRERGRAAYR